MRETDYGEERYRQLFEDSPISLWDEDFTEVGRRFQQLREAGVDDFRTYFVDNPEVVQELQRSVVIVNVNRATLDLHGAATKEELLAGLEKIFVDEPCVTFTEEMIALAEGATEFESEAIIKTMAGEERSVHLHLSVVPGGEAALSRVLVSCHDISKRKREEQERHRLAESLVHAQKIESLGTLAAGIAHEINTPTQFVGDNLRFLKDSFQELVPPLKMAGSLVETFLHGSGSSGPASELKVALEKADVSYIVEEVPRAIEQSLEGIDRVREIVRAMMDFSQNGAEEMTALDLNRAIESTITVATHEWKYVAEMETDLDSELPSVPCLPGELTQVFLGMIVNAAHAIADAKGDGHDARGKIGVSTRWDGEFAEVRIADSGTGIPEEIRGKIFDPFFSTKKFGKGTGQGLFIAHGVIVKKHGGTLNFETEIGKGTTFIIRLPLEREDDE